MSPYIVVGIALLLGTIVEVLSHKANNVIYTIMFLILLLMLVFRYGQGTDYFGYQYIFEYIPDSLNLKTLNESSIHSEIGWKFLCVLFRKLGLSYQIFIAFIGSVSMFCLNIFIKKYCPLKVGALFIAYPTLYLTYISSGMRQGLVVCIFLGIILDLYIKNKRMKFIFAVLFCSLFHTASLILFVLMFDWLKDFIVENQYVIVLFAWVGGICLSFFGVSIEIFDRTFSNSESEVSYIASLERLVTYVVIQVIYNKYKSVHKENKTLETIMFIYCISTILYGVFFSMPNISSRICYFFKVMELYIFTTIMATDRDDFPEFSTMFFYVAALSMVMLIKNLDSYISQGMYYDNVTTWNFPYNNIFIEGDFRYNYHQQLLK